MELVSNINSHELLSGYGQKLFDSCCDIYKNYLDVLNYI